MGCSSKTFDADANARAVQLVTEGYSYSQAGAAVGKTRNVVAGACHGGCEGGAHISRQAGTRARAGAEGRAQSCT
jgi:hypothetical protein